MTRFISLIFYGSSDIPVVPNCWLLMTTISSSTKVRVMTSYESIAIAKPKHCKGIIDRARSQSRSAEAARAVLEWWSAHTTHSKTRYIQDPWLWQQTVDTESSYITVCPSILVSWWVCKFAFFNFNQSYQSMNILSLFSPVFSVR